jgi:hypothetical protein
MPDVSSYPASKTVRGNFNSAEWISLMNARGVLKPDHYEKVVKRTGMGELIFDWLQAANLYRPLKSRTLTVFEEGDLERTVKISTAIATGNAGAAITLVVDADDRDTNGNVPIAANDGIVIPAAYQTSGEDRIYVITTYDADTYTATCTPLTAQGTSITASQISVEVPADTVLKIHSNYFAPGTAQPEGSTFDLYSRTYVTQIVKTSMGYEGGVQAIEWYPVVTKDGKRGAWIVGQEMAERIHNKRIDDALFLSELNDNTALTGASNAGGTSAFLSTKGLWNWALEAGQQLPYANWTADYFADVKDYLRANNVTSSEVVFWYGPDLGRDVEDENLNFIREYSGGTDLMVAGKLGISIRYFERNGIMFALKSIASFNNPNRYGGNSYTFVKKGIMYPVDSTRVEVNGSKMTMPNLQIGYLNSNGEDRTRIVRILDGMTGRESQAVNAYDTSNMYMLSEFEAIVLSPNKLIRVEPS